MPVHKYKKIPYLISSIPVEATYAWGQPVWAPLDGEVAASFDGAPDRVRISMFRGLAANLLFRPKPGSPFHAYIGNFIILRCGASIRSLRTSGVAQSR